MGTQEQPGLISQAMHYYASITGKDLKSFTDDDIRRSLEALKGRVQTQMLFAERSDAFRNLIPYYREKLQEIQSLL